MAAGGFWSVKERFIASEASKDLRLALLHPIKTFDPAVAFNDDSLTVIGQSLETLYQYHYLKRPYEIIPSLADGMPKVSPDGKVYEIRIKKGVPYYDPKGLLGPKRFVRAQDFVNQIKRLAFEPLKSTGSWLFAGKIEGFDEFKAKAGDDTAKMLGESMSGLSAPDEHTLRIELTRPEPNMLYFLCMSFTAPVPAELIQKTGNDLSRVLVGTGAFFLADTNGRDLEFERNPFFRSELYPSSGDRYANTQDLLSSSTERLPFVDRISFKVYEDESSRWQAFLDGKLDILSVPKKFLVEITQKESDLGEQLKERGIKVKHFSSISSRWLGFNMQDPLLGKNVNLRKAIAHAIDFESYISLLSNNTNLRANSIFNPSIPGYNPSHQMGYNYDLEKAKVYLSNAGIAPGELTLTYSTRGTQKIHFEEADFIKSQLARIGINVEIQKLEFSQFLKLGRAGKLQFFTDNWIYDYPDAENLLQLLVSSNTPGINKSGYKNEQVDELYALLAQTLDKKKRLSLMREIENVVDKELPWIMLMFESAYILHSPKIKNFRRSYFIRNHLKYIKKD